MWNLLSFSLHMLAGICVVADMARDYWLQGYCLALGVIIIQSLVIASLWLRVSYCCMHMYFYFNGDQKKSLMVYRIFIGTILLYIYFCWIDLYSFSLFGKIEGYPLMNPLLVLADHSMFLYFLPILGKKGLLIMFLTSCATIVLALRCKNNQSYAFVCTLSIFWMVSVGNGCQLISYYPDWLKTLKWVPYSMVGHTTSDTQLALIVKDIKAIMRMYPAHTVLLFPESSMSYVFTEKSIKKLLWNDAQPRYVVFGASYNTPSCNTLFCTDGNSACSLFCKCHAMVLSERLPWYLHDTMVQKMYFGDDRCMVSTSCNIRKKIELKGLFEFVPYICSELFFNETPEDNSDVPIIVLVNDSVFMQNHYTQYVCSLLRLATRFKAIQWQRGIVYVSYSSCFYCGSNGEYRVLE